MLMTSRLHPSRFLEFVYHGGGEESAQQLVGPPFLSFDLSAVFNLVIPRSLLRGG